MTTFEDLGLAPALLAVLERENLTRPTPIQAGAIPLALEGHDILGLAQTGTGKTMAFALPLVQALMGLDGQRPRRGARGLILAPTRELVNQIAESLRPLARGAALRLFTVIGGQSINKQVAGMERGTDILIATPGRLIDLMDRGAIDLSCVRHLVLDEADQMLDLGFIHALRRIAPELGKPRTTMLFSATMPKSMEELSQAYLTDPRRVQVAPPGKAADKIDQSVEFVDKADKPARLRDILARDPGALTLVFARTKHGAERLKKGLVEDGFDAESVHGNKTQGQRQRALNAFREGRATVLVATDVAARGLDIPGVALVVNYELPEVPDNYIHRIGRTARAGRDGAAIALCSADELELLEQVEKIMKMTVATGAGIRPESGRGAPSGAKTGRGKGRGPSKGQAGRPKPAAPKPGTPTAKPRRPRRRRAA